jgi:hypothetical protein
MKKLLPYLAILGLLVFLFQRECTRPGEVPPSSDTTVSVVIIPGDSIPYSVEIEKKVPVPYFIDTGSTRWRNLPIDTMAILADYFSRRWYNDTLMNDTSAFICVKSYVEKNQLHYEDLLFQNRRATAIYNTTIVNNYGDGKNKWYLGGGVNFLPGSPGISADVLIVTPKKMSIDGGYDFINRMGTIKAFYKISFKKKK